MKPVCLPHPFYRFVFSGTGQRRFGLAALASMLVLAGCASQAPTDQAGQASVGFASRQDADQGASTPFADAEARKLVGQDLATRHALFKVSAFDSLPGWRQDNLDDAWTAFRESCKALERKPSWKPLCVKVKAIKDAKAGRAFMEREFALLTVQNTDRSRDGEITGYYEPLLQGRAQRDARFSVPVYGVPNDLYILDSRQVPAAQRKRISHVRANGRLLVPAEAGQPGAVKIDLRRFTLDTLDRRLRVRIQGGEALPYYSRSDIARQQAMDAPVLAWVDDPIALYAMQVQGAGRIRLPDGSILRLQYADQNGHPFKPMRLAAQGNERVQTRGAVDGAGGEDGDIEHFELADFASAADTFSSAEAASDGELVTRGARKTGGAASASADHSEVAAAVDALTPKPGARPVATKGTVLNVAGRPGAKPAAQSSQLVDDLLTQAKGGRKPGSAATAAAATAKPGQRTGATTTAAPAANTVAGVSAALISQRERALNADPSYVFFRVAPDQTADAGPVGALGVPLTAGRSLAVDPRVLPLGYPVFLDAATGGKREPHMQRLMFAQDTGGAIRGAVRADYFWGFGADAGKQARRTKQKGRMWVMVPHAEVQSLLSSKLVTRGVGGATAVIDSECLIGDEAYCDDADELALGADKAAAP